MFGQPTKEKGFTLIELLVVIAIIGILSGLLLGFLNTSRQKGRDANRASQTQELLKALELYYSQNGMYPDDGTAANVPFNTIQSDLVGGGYLGRSPIDPVYPAAQGYQYCASADRRSALIATNIERDNGFSDYCHVIRGPGPDYGCDYTGGDIDAANSCADIF